MSTSKTLSPMKVVRPEACKMLECETSRKILDLLRDKELTVSEIAKGLNLTVQAIYHRIKKLENAGLVHVTREKRVGHLIESYYQATAENFMCSTEEPKGEPLKEDPGDVLNELDKIGFKIEADEETVSRLEEIQARRRKFTKLHSPVPEICVKCGSTDFFLKVGPIDPLKLDHAYHYANLIMMTDEEYEERVSLERDLRQLLLSICKEKPKA